MKIRLQVAILVSILASFLPSVVMAHGIHKTPVADSFNGRIIDDALYTESTSMPEAAIQAFLESKVPTCREGYTCLKDYIDPTVQKKASRIIWEEAIRVGLNPRVILVTLQKEQSLVTDDWPYDIQYRSAMGYGCPESQSVCDSQYYGFYNQVRLGSTLLRVSHDRFCGNNTSFPGWNGLGASWYSSDTDKANPFTIDGKPTNIYTCATAALYNYTPHRVDSGWLTATDGNHYYGNYNFLYRYSEWFGSTITNRCLGEVGPVVTGVTFRKLKQPRVDQGNLIIYSGSGSNCIESHTWNTGVQSWYSNIASNHPSVNSANAQVRYGDLNGDGIDEPVLVSLNQTGSGKVEFHIWNTSLSKWQDHVISPATAGSYEHGDFIFADVDGDRRDEPVLILLSDSGSGKIEFHVMSNDLRSWRWHVASNLATISVADGTVAFADTDGNSVDEPVLVLYRNTGSGRVEFHTWNPGWLSWRSQIASNQAAINPSESTITFADIDGNNMDEAILIGLKNTGSGKIEFHTWNVGTTSWRYHTASNQPTF